MRIYVALVLNDRRHLFFLFGYTNLYCFFFQNGESSLHAAAFSGSLPVCKQLIAAGANPSLKNQEGFTPAEVAERHRHNMVNDYLRNCLNRA